MDLRKRRRSRRTTGCDRRLSSVLATLVALFLTVGSVGAVAQHRPSGPYNTFMIQTGTPISAADVPNFKWEVGDHDGDGRSDLYAIKTASTGTATVEVHVLDAARNYGAFSIQAGTPITAADASNFSWAVGDHNGDGRSDLYAIKTANTGTGTVEVHVLAGRRYDAFSIQTGTPISAADAPNFSWGVGDHDGDGRSDLYAIKTANTGTGSVEVHVLDAASDYQSFSVHTGTPISSADGPNFAWEIGDHNGDGRPDLYGIKMLSPGTGQVETHVLAGRGYEAFSVQTATPITARDAENFAWSVGNHNGRGGDDLYALKQTNTGTETLEVHVLNSAAKDTGGGDSPDDRWPELPRGSKDWPGDGTVHDPLPVIFVHGLELSGGGTCSKWNDLSDFIGDAGYQTSQAQRVTLAYYAKDTNCGHWINHHGDHRGWKGHDKKAPHDTSTSIKHLAYHFAHYIYDHYSSRGQPVGVVAHSMGGLIVRYALAKVALGQTAFPPYLRISDVVTVATPHAGTRLCDVANFISKRPTLQCRQMERGSRFINWLAANAQAPEGLGGTDWTLMGSHDDALLAPNATAVDMKRADHTVMYEEPNYDHSDFKSKKKGRGRYDADVQFRDFGGQLFAWFDAPRSFRWIVQALWASSW